MTIKVEKFITGTGASWTKEPWAKTIRLILIGGGGPGGGGARYPAATNASGGGGGGGAAWIDNLPARKPTRWVRKSLEALDRQAMGLLEVLAAMAIIRPSRSMVLP